MSPTKPEAIRFQTPAKINTFLHIQRKRPDGYHELEMDLIPISFYDTIELAETSRDDLELISNMANVPTEENLVVKAVRLLEEEVSRKFSLKIKLCKSIPSGAGLGGGSGNAAGMLNVLNAWYKLGLSQKKLCDLALKLGADVPFFINPRPSLAKGIGEQLTELPRFEPLNVLLIYPGFPISTGMAYAKCTISGRSRTILNHTPDHFSDRNPDINDFWTSLKEKFPELNECRQALLEQGAVFSGLSGSGSTVFGIFSEESSSQNAYARLHAHNRWKVVNCKTLSDHTYFPMS